MIVIIGKRWFQRTNGNTYHSCRVLVDGLEIGFAPFRYGYGDQYLQTAHELLQVAGVYPKTGKHFASGADADYSGFMDDMREHRENFTIVCVDVDRKKDL